MDSLAADLAALDDSERAVFVRAIARRAREWNLARACGATAPATPLSLFEELIEQALIDSRSETIRTLDEIANRALRPSE